MVDIITCKIGNSIINSFDNNYDRSQLKEWSDKNILKCPVCGSTYEYCHGMIVHPYFRHKDKSKECEGLYYESETEEHIQGKIILYNWLKNLENKELVSNVQLESYIKETKQRPDLYFEQNGTRYVIEFQCTPISTEYLKRRELYRLAGIKDIWILGLEKYQIDGKNKTIEEKGTQLKLDVTNNIIYTDGSLLKRSLPHKCMNCNNQNEFKLDDLVFDGEILLCDEKLKPFIKKDTTEYKKWKKIIEAEEIKLNKDRLQREFNKEIVSKVEKLFVIVRQYNKDKNYKLDVTFKESDKKRYCCRIEVFSPRFIGKHIYFFFGKDGVSCSKRIILDKKTGYSDFVENGQCEYSGIDFTKIEGFIKGKIDELQKEELSEHNH